MMKSNYNGRVDTRAVVNTSKKVQVRTYIENHVRTEAV